MSLSFTQKDTCLKTYEAIISPIPGDHEWVVTAFCPPIIRRPKKFRVRELLMNLGIHTRFLERISLLDVENVIKLDTIQGHARLPLRVTSPGKGG